MDQGDKEKAATFSKYLERVFRPINGVDTSIVEQLKEDAASTFDSYQAVYRCWSKMNNMQIPKPQRTSWPWFNNRENSKGSCKGNHYPFNRHLQRVTDSYYEYELVSRDSSV